MMRAQVLPALLYVVSPLMPIKTFPPIADFGEVEISVLGPRVVAEVEAVAVRLLLVIPSQLSHCFRLHGQDLLEHSINLMVPS